MNDCPPPPLFRVVGVVRLLLAQAQVAFNDNAAKLALMGLAPLVLPAEAADGAVNAIAALLVAPYVVFAPIVGWITDHYPKRRVVGWSLALQAGVMGVLCLALWLRRFEVVLFLFFVLGFQSCLMSPAKRGLAGELAGRERIGEVMGFLEMLVVASILLGSLAGGYLLKELVGALGDPWRAGALTAAILSLGCIFAWAVFNPVPLQQPIEPRPYRHRLWFGHFRQLRDLWDHPVVFKAALGDAVFYFIGGAMVLVLARVGRDLYPGQAQAIWVTATMTASLGAGIIVGALTAARICRRGIQSGLIPVGALGICSGLVGLSLLPPASGLYYFSLVWLGFFGGWFLVPLSSLLVAESPEGRRGELLAGSSLLTSFAGVLAVAAFALASQVFDWSMAAITSALAVLTLASGIYLVQLLPDSLIRLFGLGVAALHYRVRPHGASVFPARGGVLLVCNHVSYVDALILSIACPRPPRFLSLESLFRVPILGSVLRIFGAIPISSTHAKEAIRAAVGAVQSGEVVCLFPEGQLTTTGKLAEVRGGFELIARKADCPVVAVHLDGLWGSIFSFERGRFFWKWPRRWKLDVNVRFSEPMTPHEATAARVEAWWRTCAAHGLDERLLGESPRTTPDPEPCGE